MAAGALWLIRPCLEWTMEVAMVLAALKILADAAKFTNVIIAGFRKCRDLVGVSEKVRCSSKIKPRLHAEWVVVREKVVV